MASLNHLMMLVILLIVFLSLHSTASSKLLSHPKFEFNNTNNDLFSRTCNKTDDFIFCMNILQSYPLTASAPNPLALAGAVLNLAMVDTIIAREQIRVLLRRKETKPELHKPVQSCVDLYDEAAKQFNVSSLELAEDPLTASYDAALAGANSGSCEKALASARVKVPEISALNKKLTSFFRISMAVTELLGPGSSAAKSPPI